MGIFKKDDSAAGSRMIHENKRLTSQLPKPSAREQKAIDGSVGRGLNGTNRRQN